MTINVLKTKFKDDIRFMYPQGLDLPLQLKQFRDLVRVWLMGVVTSCMLTHRPQEVAEFQFDLAIIADVDWWPDNSWKWWF